MPSFNRLVISGTLASGAETFSTSCAFRPSGGGTVGTQEGVQGWADDIADGIDGTWLGTELLNGLGSTGMVTGVRMYFYGGIGQPATQVGIATCAKAGLTSPSRPTSVAAVCSLRTTVAGRRYRGRMYWPAMGNTINTTGRFTSSVTLNLATQMGVFLSLVRDATPGGDLADPVIVSQAADLTTTVVAVGCGDVPDAMRSRRDALVENYTTIPVP